MVREMQDDQKAYPIIELASLFLQKPDHYLVKLQTREPGKGETAVRFFQYLPTQAVATSRERLVQAVVARHLDEFFDVEQIEGEAPRGNFPCVTRCTLTGTLLGPPNYHGTQARIQEMVAERFSGMGLEAYRARLETVRDPELVEKWKQESRVQKRYRLKPKPSAEETPPQPPPPADEKPEPEAVPVAEPDATSPAPPENAPPVEAAEETATPEAPPEETPVEEAPAEETQPETEPDSSEETAAPPAASEEAPSLTLEEAKQYFVNTLLPGLIRESKKAVMPATVAQTLEDPAIKFVIRDAWQRESRFPLSLSLAMRPAFKHMRLHLFKVNRKQVFVTAVPPKPLDADAAVDAIQRELQFLREHPGCTRQELVQGLCPEEPVDSPRVTEVVGNLRWLVDKGHVIEFYNGKLSLPSARQSSRQGGRRPGPAPAKDQPPAPTAPAPAAEPVAPPESPAEPEAAAVPPPEPPGDAAPPAEELPIAPAAPPEQLPEPPTDPVPVAEEPAPPPAEESTSPPADPPPPESTPHRT